MPAAAYSDDFVELEIINCFLENTKKTIVESLLQPAAVNLDLRSSLKRLL
jgi:hypothetical protein